MIGQQSFFTILLLRASLHCSAARSLRACGRGRGSCGETQRDQ